MKRKKMPAGELSQGARIVADFGSGQETAIVTMIIAGTAYARPFFDGKPGRAIVKVPAVFELAEGDITW